MKVSAYRQLIIQLSAALYLVGALIALGSIYILPRTEGFMEPVAVALAILGIPVAVVLYVIPWPRCHPNWYLAKNVVALVHIALFLWATGGNESRYWPFLIPVVVVSAAYYRDRWPLLVITGLILGVTLSPLLYDGTLDENVLLFTLMLLIGLAIGNLFYRKIEAETTTVRFPGGGPALRGEWERMPATPQAVEHLRRRLYQAVAGFRFFAFALGVAFMFMVDITTLPDPSQLAPAVAVGIVNAGRVVLPPLHLSGRPGVESGALLVEMLLILGLVVLSGGVQSPFLIHSLSPVFSSALFLGWATTLALGVAGATVVAGGHLAGTLVGGLLAGITESNILSFVLLYAAAMALVVGLPFVTNINLDARRRLAARQEERDRLRREVHDDIAQTLAFLSLKVQRIQERRDAGRPVIRIRDLREISHGVRRAYLNVRDYLEEGAVDTGAQSLGAGLAALARAWERETGLKVNLEARGEDAVLPAGIRRHLVQIAREAVVNARKHGRSSQVTVAVECFDSVVTLRAQDDGRGMPPGTPWGLGLTGMWERATLIGAELEVHSNREQGTEVVVHLPLSKEDTG